jgi:hypothetical protein
MVADSEAVGDVREIWGELRGVRVGFRIISAVEEPRESVSWERERAPGMAIGIEGVEGLVTTEG